MAIEQLRVEMELSAAEAAEYLERIAAGLRCGAVQVRVNRREMWLRPDPTVTLEIRGRGKADEGRLVLGLSWNSKFVAIPEEVQIGAGDPIVRESGYRSNGRANHH
jgi:amphi-Trp domain-containing protein